MRFLRSFHTCTTADLLSPPLSLACPSLAARAELKLSTGSSHLILSLLIHSFPSFTILFNLTANLRSPSSAHRFGQKEDVKIYKITVDNTIEDRILTLQEEKAEIAKAALEGGDMTKANKLSMRDMLFLFRGDGEGVREGKSKGKGKARDDESD